MWYGGSSIAARLLNYLLTPYLTYKLSGPSYGEISLVYAAIPFLNVIFTYGIETAYFRFSSKAEYKNEIYNTASISIIISTIFLTTFLLLSTTFFSHLLRFDAHSAQRPQVVQVQAGRCDGDRHVAVGYLRGGAVSDA